MVTSDFYEQNEAGIIFKFNYTDNRELYEVGPQRGGVLPKNLDLLQPSITNLTASTCGNGDYYHDNSKNNRQLHLCASGKNRW